MLRKTKSLKFTKICFTKSTTITKLTTTIHIQSTQFIKLTTYSSSYTINTKTTTFSCLKFNKMIT